MPVQSRSGPPLTSFLSHDINATACEATVTSTNHLSFTASIGELQTIPLFCNCNLALRFCDYHAVSISNPRTRCQPATPSGQRQRRNKHHPVTNPPYQGRASKSHLLCPCSVARRHATHSRASAAVAPPPTTRPRSPSHVLSPRLWHTAMHERTRKTKTPSSQGQLSTPSQAQTMRLRRATPPSIPIRLIQSRSWEQLRRRVEATH